MFSKKKEVRRHPNGAENKGRNLSQFGLLDTGGMDFDLNNMGSFDDDDDDEGLEAELLAITSGKMPPKPYRRPKGIRDMNALNALVAESIKDESDEDDDDADLENDPTLLAELQQLTPDDEEMVDVDAEKEPSPTPPPLPQRRAPPPPQISTNDDASPESSEKSTVQILEERIAAYNTAISLSKTLGETSKIRRFERGLKTLHSLLKSAKNGKPINEEEIPPMVVTSTKRAPSPQPPSSESSILAQDSMPSDTFPSEIEKPYHPEPSEAVIDSTTLEQDRKTEASIPIDALNTLTTRRDQYKHAALTSKRAGDTETAVKFIKIAKQFDNVINALEQGHPVDLSLMPPPPPGFSDSSSAVTDSAVTNDSFQTSSLPNSSAQEAAPTEQSSEESLDEGALFKAPSAPTTVLEALEQRLEKYQSSQKEAQDQGNSSKARRMGRIVKQYQDAIKMHKAGKPVAYDDLPAPPGFGPIPHGNGSSSTSQPPPPKAESVHPSAPPAISAPSLVPSTPAAKEEPVESTSDASGPSRAVPPPLPPRQRPSAGKATSVKRNTQSLHDKQLSMLEERQRLFREAALQSKKRGDLQAAKEYLRQSKGFAPMIEAAKCGLPVSMDSAPIPPQLQKEDSFEVIEYEDCIPPGDRTEAFEKLEEDLKTQIATCMRTSNHFGQLGDIGSSKKFRVLAEHATKDLTALRHAFKRGDDLPRFHYQMKTYSIVRCFTDLTDNDLELTIVRGINYSCSNPKEIDTYVKFEFPYPSDAPPHERTSTVKDTNNPEYNKAFLLAINRKARAMARIFKRGAVKFEVIAKGGFFRSDSLLGTVQVKLAPLETKCQIHDSFDLMDGRKPVGGKLEIKIRIREPLLTKQVEEISEKWLVIDQYK